MSHPLFDLSGKTALITGSSQGIGNGLAQGLAEAGARVVLNFLRSIPELIMGIIFVAAVGFGPLPGVLALGLPAKAAFMPLLIGIPGALLCAAQLVIDLRRAATEPQADAPAEQDVAGMSELASFVWLGLFAGALLGFGFIVGAPIIVTAYVKFASRDTWANALFAGGGTFVVMYGMFIWLLELSVFQGLILERLLG